jgi:hypothetical protein
MKKTPFEQYDNLSQLPYDLVTFIIQIMENRCRETHHFLINNQFYLHDIKVNVTTFPIEPFYEKVIQWEECDCRGRPHIENMKSDIKDGYKVPPVVHNIERGFSSPIDGRHRTIALKELGYTFVESISMEDIMRQVKEIQENSL